MADCEAACEATTLFPCMGFTWNNATSGTCCNLYGDGNNTKPTLIATLPFAKNDGFLVDGTGCYVRDNIYPV